MNHKHSIILKLVSVIFIVSLIKITGLAQFNITKLNPTFTKNGTVLSSIQANTTSEHLVYLMETEGVTELFSIPLAGGNPIRLNPDFSLTEKDVSIFKISPDGSRVIYLADQLTNEVVELFSVPVGGGMAVKLNDNFAGPDADVLPNNLQFTPDGNQVIFLADQNTDSVFELFSVPTLGGTATQLSPDFTFAFEGVNSVEGNVKISSDGSTVVYNMRKSGEGFDQLFSVPITGGTSTLLSEGKLIDTSIVALNFLITLDGNQVVFRQRRNGIIEIFSVPINGLEPPKKLCPDLAFNQDVEELFRISPDGSRVIYIADQVTNDVLELFSVPTDGSAPAIKLNPDFPDDERDVFLSSSGEFLQISPDGNRVVYLADPIEDNQLNLFSVPIDGSAVAVRLNPDLPTSFLSDVQQQSIRISPNSSRVIFTADAFTNQEFDLFSAPIDGSAAATKLTPERLSSGESISSLGLQISPDGSRVLYRSDHETEGVTELFSVPILGGASVKLNLPFPDEERDVTSEDLQITPNGNQVIFKADQFTNQVLDVFIVPLAGGIVKKLDTGLPNIFGDVSPFDIQYTPDGNTVVFITDESDGSNIFSASVNGGAVVQLNPDSVDVSSVFSKISPDGSKVVFNGKSRVTNKRLVYSVPTNGGAAVQLNPNFADNQRFISDVQISPDGSRVIYRADQDIDDATELFSVPIDGGTVTKLHPDLPGNRDVGSTKINANGVVVFHADLDNFRQKELYSVPIEGGTVTKLDANLPSFGDVNSQFAISPDGNQVLYTCDRDVDRAFELFIIPITGGTPTKLNPDFTNDDQDVRAGTEQFSPDGSRVVYIADVTENVFELFSVPADGSAPAIKLHTDFTGTQKDVDFSTVKINATSSRVIYLADQNTDNVEELFSVPIAGGTSTKLNPNFPDNNRDVADFGVQVSPDGSKVIYGSDQETDGLLELFSVPINGGTAVKLNPTPSNSIDPARAEISPNGQQVLYVSDHETSGVEELFIVSIDGGTSTKINPDFPDNDRDIEFLFRTIQFSPSGNHIIYLADQETNNQVELFSAVDICTNDTTPPVPNVADLPNITAPCNATVTAPKATDSCAGEITATTTNPTTYDQQGIFTITWTYDDGNGNTSTQQQTVVVDDTTPPTIVLNGAATITLACGATTYVDEGATPADNCVGVTLETTGTVDATTPGTYTINYQARDAANNESTTITRTIIVPSATACNDCAIDRTIAANGVIAPGDYIAESSLTSNGTVENGSTVTFIAGQEITLTAGFTVVAGANFKAIINQVDCLNSFADGDAQPRNAFIPSSSLVSNDLTLIAQPNPFYGETQLHFQLPKAQQISLALFDQTGRFVQTLIPTQQKVAGVHALRWQNDTGLSGLFFAVLQTSEAKMVCKLLILK
ncbi:MAG: DPP IV N-terminal domain-containing protein [Bacteroidota bacterium]